MFPQLARRSTREEPACVAATVQAETDQAALPTTVIGSTNVGFTVP
jgi:hypothetical protein